MERSYAPFLLATALATFPSFSSETSQNPSLPVGDLYVDAANGDDANDGTSWSEAKASIQAAIDIASEGATIIVNDGRYTPISTANKTLTIRSVNGPDFTIVDGGATNRCATLGEIDQTNSCLYAFCLTNGAEHHGGGSSGGTLEHCLISGNSAVSSGGGALGGRFKDCTIVSNTAAYGGGVYEGSLTKCVITKNSVSAIGGGTYNATLDRCTVEGNTANSGGGICAGHAIDCTVTGNNAKNGGGIHNAKLDYCFISGNEAKEYGGGDNAGTLNNCVLWKNKAGQGGGSYMGTLNNCTIVGNEAEEYGGGASYAWLTNCIVWGNVAQRESTIDGATCRYCCLDDEDSGMGNIFVDPLFFDAENGDFRLRAGSPCINAGTNDTAGAYIDGTDFYRYPRLSGGRIDIGAAEARWNYPVWATAHGLGAPDVVTEGTPNLVRYVFDKPSGIFSPFTDFFFQDGAPVLSFESFNSEIYDVSMSVLSSTNILDWSHAEVFSLPDPLPDGNILDILPRDAAPQRFYKFKVEEL